ncbi:hypothetical protein ACFE04_016885 [Oxalis oulophora]
MGQQHIPLPNGLLPNQAASVIQGLDLDRWTKAEDRTAQLIICIQPNLPSEHLRNAVADYVQRLIINCFPCQVFTFGSVPLKTYLPDGDIDLSAFCENQALKDTWAHQVRHMLETEERSNNALFRVKEVQYIQAEVKIIKCLVENIVVDISFNQVGGLCTLCFLEHVDNLIEQNHLFKRSIILIKAWCYYESRILGAHHGLISTYALETLVLYIFNVFKNSFAGPLEVLYRFLDFFSKFDWDNFCVSIWGPVPINLLPDISAQTPRKDGEQVLNKMFLQAYSMAYAVRPFGQENQGQPFVSKHFNVIDPLRENNNLGRSVSKGNFYRIRSAFTFGAKRLARLLDCPKEDLYYEVNQFFMNTWERHGSGHRLDAPRKDLLRFSNLDPPNEPEKSRNKSVSKTHVSSVHETQVDRMPGGNNSLFSQNNENLQNDKSQRSTMHDNSVAGVQGKYLFARTRSSPELLAETYGQGRRSRAPQGQVSSSTRMDQEEQDLVNLMASSSPHNFNGVHLPLNLASGHLPLPIPPSMLASMGYAPRNLNIPLNKTPWGKNMQFPPNLVSSSLTNYLAGLGLTSNHGDFTELGHEHFERYHESWHEQDRGSTGGVDLNNENYDVSRSDDKQQQSTSADNSYVGAQHKSSRESRESASEGQFNTFQYQENRINESYSDNRIRSVHGSHASSTRSKTSSESSREGSSVKVSKSSRDKRGRKLVSSKGKNVFDHSSIQIDEDNRDWVPPLTMGTEISERNTESQTNAPLLLQSHQLSGYEPAQNSGSDSLIPLGPMLLGPDSRQKTADNSGALPYAFYPTGPPVPFVTMLPLYNFPSENNKLGLTFDSSDGLVQYDMSSTSNSVRTISEQHKVDILNGDFASHLQNLQYGRLCQSSRQQQPSPMIYPSPLVVPPGYLQGRFPWDGPGRPLSGNMNLFTQLMSYVPQLVPVGPPQSVSSRPVNVYQHFADEIPRHRSGTGTYLPNPKTTVRDRHANSRRGNYNNSYERNDHHSGRESNSSPKPRPSWRNRNQAEKLNSRTDRSNERSWSSNRHDTYPTTYQSRAPNDVAYGMYPLPAMNANGGSSNGPTISSSVMFYPYDQNAGYGSVEQPEFGNMGPMSFVGVNETSHSQLSEESHSNFHGGTQHRSSSDQPPSPYSLRYFVFMILTYFKAPRNDQFKDEDSLPLACPNGEIYDGNGFLA